MHGRSGEGGQGPGSKTRAETHEASTDVRMDGRTVRHTREVEKAAKRIVNLLMVMVKLEL